MPTPQPHKTSVSLDADVYLMLQSIVAQRKDWTQTDAINACVRFYHAHADDPQFDLMSAKLDTIAKRLDDLLSRTTAPLDTDALAQVIVSHLTPPAPPPAPPAPPPPAPLPTPTTPRWSERFSKRFRTPPPEHW